MSKNRFQELIQLIRQNQQLQQMLKAAASPAQAAELIVNSIGKGFTAEEVSRALAQMASIKSSDGELSEQDLLAVSGGACGYTNGLTPRTSSLSHSCCVTK